MKKFATLMVLLCAGLFVFSGCGDSKDKPKTDDGGTPKADADGGKS